MNILVPVAIRSLVLISDCRRIRWAAFFFYRPHPVRNLPITVNFDQIYCIYPSMCVADIIIRQYDARLLSINLPHRDEGLQAFRLLPGNVDLLAGIVCQIV